jgi:hypothetical protein
MIEYPKHVYHADGGHQVVNGPEAHKALGTGWDAKPNDKHLAAIRKASGAVSEVVVPVTSTRPEKV